MSYQEELRVKITGDARDFSNETKKATSSAGQLEGKLKGIFGKFENRSINIGVKESGASSTATAISAVDKAADKLDGRDVTVDINADQKGIADLGGSFRELSGNIRAVGTVLKASSIPFAIAGIGAATPTVLALGASLGGLAVNLGKAGAGFAAIGGVAAGGALAGLKAYTAVISSTVSASREAYEAAHEQRMEQLEKQKQDILNTKASEKFNQQIDKSSIAFTKLQAAVGKEVFPTFTKELKAWTGLLPELQKPLMDLVGGVTNQGRVFSEYLRAGEGLERLKNILGFVARQGERAAGVLGNLGVVFTTWVDIAIPAADRLTEKFTFMIGTFSRWTQSAKGISAVKGVMAGLEVKMIQVGKIVANLGRGIFGLFDLINRSGIGDQAQAGLARLASGFAAIGREGSKTRTAVSGFLNQARALMPSVGGAVMALGREFFRVAGAVIQMRSAGSKLTILQQIFRGVQQAAKPLGNLLIGTFGALGPEIARLIPNLARLAETFAGSSGPLVAYTKFLNRAMEMFNKLPGPVKTVIANLVAFKLIVGGLGLGGLIGGLGRTAAQFWAMSRASRASALALKQTNLANKGVATSNAAAGATAVAAGGKWKGLTGIFGRLWGLMKTFGRFLGKAGPWGIAIGLLVAAGVAVYKNWNKIAPMLKPLWNVLKQIWGVVKQLAREIGKALMGALRAFIKGISNTVTGGKKWDEILRQVAKTIFNLANKYLPTVAKWVDKFTKFMKDSQPTITRVGEIVGGLLVDGFKIWLGVLKGAVVVIRTVVNVIRGLAGAFKKFVDWAPGAWGRFWQGVKDTAGNAASWVRDRVDDLRRGLSTSVGNIASEVRKRWDAFWDGVRHRFDEFRENLGGAISDWRSGVRGQFDDLKTGIGETWSNMWTSIGARWDQFKTRTGEGIRSWLQDAKQWFADGFQGMGEMAIEKLGNAVNTLRHWLGSLLWSVGNVLEVIGADTMAKGARTMAENLQDPLKFAKGGVYTGDAGGAYDGRRVVAITNEAGPEGIMPLNKFTSGGLEAFQAGLPIYGERAGVVQEGDIPPRGEHGIPFTKGQSGGPGWPPYAPLVRATGGDGVVDFTATDAAREAALAAAPMWRGLVKSGGNDVTVGRSPVSLGGAYARTYQDGRIVLGPKADKFHTGHEFGHTLGLGHGGMGIMGGYGRKIGGPHAKDFEAIQAYYGGRNPAAGGSGGSSGGSGGGSGFGGMPTSPTSPAQQASANSNPYGTLAGRIDDTGSGSGGFGPTANHLWNSDTFGRVIEVLKQFRVSANTYTNHPPDAPGMAGQSADFWDYAGRGTPIPIGLNDQVRSYIQNNLATGLSWTLGEGDPGHTGSDRHVHATWGSSDPATPDIAYQGGTGTDSGAAISGMMMSIKDKFGNLWKTAADLVQHYFNVDFLTDPGFGWIGKGLLGFAGDLITETKEWLANTAGEMFGMGGTGAVSASGDLEQWIVAGLNEDGLFAASPENVAGYKALAMQESGGDPSAVQQITDINSTMGGYGGFDNNLARGLLQNTPQSWEGNRNKYGADPGLADPNIFDPVKSVMMRARNQMAALGHISFTAGYRGGGVIPGKPGDPVLIQAHAGERVLPREVVQGFDSLSRSIVLWTRQEARGGTRGAREVSSDGMAVHELRMEMREIKELLRDGRARFKMENGEVIVDIASAFSKSPTGKRNQSENMAEEIEIMRGTRPSR